MPNDEATAETTQDEVALPTPVRKAVVIGGAITVLVLAAGSVATLVGGTQTAVYSVVSNKVIAQAEASAKGAEQRVTQSFDAKLAKLTAVVQKTATIQAKILEDDKKRQEQIDSTGSMAAVLICDRANGEPVGSECLWFKRNGEVKKRVALTNMKELQQALAVAARKRRRK